MNSAFIDSAIRDVAPLLSDPYPAELRKLTGRLFNASRQRISLKQHEEVARYHLSAIVALHKLRNELNFISPSFENFPLPSKTAHTLSEVFKSKLSTESAINTPAGTPQKKRPAPSEPSTPSTSSPNKRGRPPGSRTKTPFMRRLEAVAASSPSPSPSKNLIKVLSQDNVPQEAETPPDTSPLKSLKLLSSREITTMCNKFQLDESIAKNIVETFQKYSTKVSNEWILICGLVLNCYFIVNYETLKDQIGAKSEVLKLTFSLQNGGLMMADIQSSIEFVKNLISYNKWFKNLKRKYNHPIDKNVFLQDSGNFISLKNSFSSSESDQKYQEWESSIRHEISLRNAV